MYKEIISISVLQYMNYLIKTVWVTWRSLYILEIESNIHHKGWSKHILLSREFFRLKRIQ
jgi:hypothetical protein